MKLNLNPGEELLYTYHETEIVLAKTVLIIFVGLYVPWFFAIKYDVVLQYRMWLLVWTLVLLAYGLRSYLIWSMNRYIITSKRLVRMLHNGIFKRVVMETPLERILNVSYKTTGLPSSLLGYGDVEVQVVGLIDPITLKNIKRPQQIKDYLWQLHESSMTDKDAYTSEHIEHLQEQAGYTKKNQKVL